MSVALVDQWPYCDIETREEWPKRSPEGTVWYRSETLYEKGSAADLGNARQQFRFRSDEEWVALFDRAPHILHQILGDIFRETVAERERMSGQARIGRRPKVVDGSLSELYGMITPRYSMEPFPEAVKALIEKAPSLRAFAKRAKMGHHTITRMMRGEVALERWRLEALARAGQVHPAYFMEYREMVIAEALLSLLRRRPNVGVRIHKQIRQAAEG